MNAPSRTYARRCTLALLLASVVGAVAPLAHADEVTSADGREVALQTGRRPGDRIREEVDAVAAAGLGGGV